MSVCQGEKEKREIETVTVTGFLGEIPGKKWFGCILYKSFLNLSILIPASLMIPAIVKELTGFDLGTVIIRSPLVMVICFPCLAIRNPAFSKAFTARW
jgi:hypothetical protein